MDLNFTLADLQRRLANTILYGKISAVDLSTARAKVRAGDLVTGWRPWLTAMAGGARSWWSPKVGEQVVLLSPYGDPAQAVILPGLYQDSQPAPSDNKDLHLTEYADGTRISYDQAEKKFTLELCEGGEAIVTGHKVLVEADELNFGGLGGEPIARIGDEVEVLSGSSAGRWKIVTGSEKARAT